VEYGDRGHCPKCGRFCGKIVGTIRNEGLDKVTGICRMHGEVDLSDQDWGYEDFDEEDHTANDKLTDGGHKTL